MWSNPWVAINKWLQGVSLNIRTCFFFSILFILPYSVIYIYIFFFLTSGWWHYLSMWTFNSYVRFHIRSEFEGIDLISHVSEFGDMLYKVYFLSWMVHASWTLKYSIISSFKVSITGTVTTQEITTSKEPFFFLAHLHQWLLLINLTSITITSIVQILHFCGLKFQRYSINRFQTLIILLAFHSVCDQELRAFAWLN